MTRPRLALLLPDVDLDDVARVKDNLADEGAVAGADLAQHSLSEVEHTADRPVHPEDADLTVRAVGWSVGPACEVGGQIQVL